MPLARRSSPPKGSSSLSRVVGIVLLATGPAHAAEVEVAVPRGIAVVVDGILDPTEWRDATTRPGPEGIEIRLQHDGSDLYLAVTSPRPGFTSLCLARGDSVDVLHASAALGAVRYERRSREWTTRATEFFYGMRNRERTASARAERRRYLDENGWVASTYGMGPEGGGMVQELHLAADRLAGATGLALAFFVLEGDSGRVLAWPATMATADGCADAELVRGVVPPRLAFDPGRWAALDLAP